MEEPDTFSLDLVSIPVIGVLSCLCMVCVVFVYGYRSVTPPVERFQVFDDNANEKKNKKIKKKKNERTTLNGTAKPVKQVNEKVSKSQAPKAQAKQTDISSTTTPKQPSKTTSSKKKKTASDNTRNAPLTSQEQDDINGDGWITPLSRKQQKQNKQVPVPKDTEPQPAISPPTPPKIKAGHKDDKLKKTNDNSSTNTTSPSSKSEENQEKVIIEEKEIFSQVKVQEESVSEKQDEEWTVMESKKSAKLLQDSPKKEVSKKEVSPKKEVSSQGQNSQKKEKSSPEKDKSPEAKTQGDKKDAGDPTSKEKSPAVDESSTKEHSSPETVPSHDSSSKEHVKESTEVEKPAEDSSTSGSRTKNKKKKKKGASIPEGLISSDSAGEQQSTITDIPDVIKPAVSANSPSLKGDVSDHSSQVSPSSNDKPLPDSASKKSKKKKQKSKDTSAVTPASEEKSESTEKSSSASAAQISSSPLGTSEKVTPAPSVETPPDASTTKTVTPSEVKEEGDWKEAKPVKKKKKVRRDV